MIVKRRVTHHLICGDITILLAWSECRLFDDSISHTDWGVVMVCGLCVCRIAAIGIECQLKDDLPFLHYHLPSSLLFEVDRGHLSMRFCSSSEQSETQVPHVKRPMARARRTAKCDDTTTKITHKNKQPRREVNWAMRFVGNQQVNGDAPELGIGSL